MGIPNYSGGNNNVGLVCQNCTPKDEIETEDEPLVKIRACLFFDGTLNNRTNVGIGSKLKDSKKKLKEYLKKLNITEKEISVMLIPSIVKNNPIIYYKKQKIDDNDFKEITRLFKNKKFLENNGSYENDFSNISKLEQFWDKDKEVDYSFSLYIEGIGTEDKKGDSTKTGGAFGMGDTGVIAKVEKGIALLIKRINSITSNKKIDYIYLDAFGFSRGAAAARYFVHAILEKTGETLMDQLTKLGYSINTIDVKFIGLFDTVASYGTVHFNDTEDLHLDSISQAERVVQLVADEEHREKFRLTNINSASNGLEIYLPGVHSDIGGGYTDPSRENELQILDLDGFFLSDRLAQEKEWLINFGWYREGEIEDINFWNELKVNRNTIYNHYNRIPLHLMVRLANENDVKFLSKIKVIYLIPQPLIKIKDEIDSYVAKNNFKPNDWFYSKSDTMKALRHDYLHFSAFYGSSFGAHAPQWSNNDSFKGKRERVIQDG